MLHVGGIHLSQYSRLEGAHLSPGKAPCAPLIIKGRKYGMIHHVWKQTSTYHQMNYTLKVPISHNTTKTCPRCKRLCHRYLKLATLIYFSSLTWPLAFPLFCSLWLPIQQHAKTMFLNLHVPQACRGPSRCTHWRQGSSSRMRLCLWPPKEAVFVRLSLSAILHLS